MRIDSTCQRINWCEFILLVNESTVVNVSTGAKLILLVNVSTGASLFYLSTNQLVDSTCQRINWCVLILRVNVSTGAC